MKKYIHKLKLSITSIDYYLEAIKKPFHQSFNFFFVSMIILGLLLGANFATNKLPKFKNNAYLALDELKQNFDQDLEIIWADNQLELNRDYLIINWPSKLDYKKYNLPKNLGLISNSQTDPTKSEKLKSLNPLIYINNNNFYILQKPNSNLWSKYPLDVMFQDVNSYSINKQNLPRVIDGIKNAVDKSFIKIQIIQIIFSTIFFLISRLWFLLIESALVYFLFKIYLFSNNNFKFSFKQVLKLNLNILVPTEIIHLTSSLLYKNINLPMDSIAFWVILSFVSIYIGKRTKK